MGDEQRTHLEVSTELCGEPLALGEGWSRVSLTVSEIMRADEEGLAHGGFLFGVADYAAMLAVNDPNVVLGQAEIRFLEPVQVGDKLEAEARVESESGKKRSVGVAVFREGARVCEGRMTCFVPERHVLDPLL